MKKFLCFLFLLTAVAGMAAGADPVPGGMQFRILEKTPFKEPFLQQPSSEFRFDCSLGLSAPSGTGGEWSDTLALTVSAFTGLYCDGNFSTNSESPHQFFSTFLLSESGKTEISFSATPDFKLLQNPAGLSKITLSRTGIYFQLIGVGAANFRERRAKNPENPLDDGLGPARETPPGRECRSYIFDLVVYLEPIPAVINDRLTLFMPGNRVQTLAKIEVRLP